MQQLQTLTPLQQALMGALLRLVTREYAVITFAAVMQQLQEFVSNNADCYVAAARYSDGACARALDELVAEGLLEYVEANACRLGMGRVMCVRCMVALKHARARAHAHAHTHARTRTHARTHTPTHTRAGHARVKSSGRWSCWRSRVTSKSFS